MKRARIERDTWAVTLGGFLLLLVYGHRAGQDLNWDFLNYHFYAGYMLLHGRLGLDIIPAMMQTYLNPLPNVLPYLAIRYLPPWTAATALTAVHVLNLTGVYVLAKAVFANHPRDVRVPMALLCVAVGLTGPSFLPEVGSSMADATTSVLVTFALVCAVIGVRSGGWRSLVAAGLLVGAAAGLKQTNALFALGLGLALLAVPGGPLERLRRGAVYGMAAGASALVMAMPWLVMVYREFGNPLYPFYNKLFRSPLGPIANPGDYRYFPASLWEGLGYPMAWLLGRNPAGEIALRDARFVVLMALVLAAVAAWAFRRLTARRAEEAPADPAGPWSRVAIGLAAYFVASHAVWIITLRTSHPMLLGLVTLLGAIPLAWCLYRRPASPAPEETGPERRVVVLLGVYLTATFLIWLEVFAVERYLLPFELVSGVLIAALLSAVTHRERLCQAIFAVLCLGVVVWAQPAYFPRLPWSGQWIPAELPAAVQAPDVLYVMTGHDPYACLIPLFPESARFIRIDGNYPLFHDRHLGKVALGRIQAHSGEVRALIPVADERSAIAKLADFGLRPGKEVGTLRYIQGPIKLVKLEWIQVSSRPPVRSMAAKSAR